MTKYIDADRFRAEIENLIEKYSSIKAKGVLQEGYKGGRLIGYEDTLNKLDSLQKEQRKLGVFVPEWCLENIQDTLRIQYNINSDKATGETCQDRNIKESLNELQKILNGEELTGMERLEPLKQEQQKVDLEKEINRYCGTKDIRPVPDFMDAVARHFYELGRNSK